MTPDALAALHAKASTSPWSARSFEAQLSLSGSVLVTQPYAFALGRIIVDDVELLQIATDPTHQRQGLGRSVLREFETLAHQRGCRRGLLEVASLNTRAIALYTSAGWVIDGKRTNYYRMADGQYDDAWLMSKNL